MSIRVDPDWWKSLFDDLYLLTDARSVCDPRVTRAETDLLCEMLDLEPEHRILDLCGGHGRHSFELHARGCRDCTLVDYSPVLIARARRHAREAGVEMTIRRADARDTGLAPDQFDRVIIMGNSLGYVDEPTADRDILAEARRVLKTGGRVLVDVVNGETLHDRFTPRAWHEIGNDVVVCREREITGDRVRAREVVLSRKEGLLRDQTYSIRFYTPASLRRTMQAAGFGTVAVKTEFSPHDDGEDYGCMNDRMLAVGVKGTDAG